MVSKSFNTGSWVKVEKAYKHAFIQRNFFFFYFYLLDLDCIFEADTDILEFKNLISIH